MPDTGQLDASRNGARDGIDIGGAADSLIAVIRQSLRIESHFDLYQWLQGDLQAFLPHQILLACWGNFALGELHYDVISALQGVRTAHLDQHDLNPVTRTLFNEWQHRGCQPFTTDYPIGLFIESTQPTPIETGILNALRTMKSSLVHGLRDQRGRHDCLYIALHREEETAWRDHDLFEMLLPFIETALRRIALFPAETAHVELAVAAPILETSPSVDLSDREAEIMRWVRQGKTNLEIGSILDISAFTVKNHLQRIFRKLNVGNRAQAVALFEDRARSVTSP